MQWEGKPIAVSKFTSHYSAGFGKAVASILRQRKGAPREWPADFAMIIGNGEWDGMGGGICRRNRKLRRPKGGSSEGQKEETCCILLPPRNQKIVKFLPAQAPRAS